MEGRPERIADYFVVVGVGCESVTRFEAFSSEEEQRVLPGDTTEGGVVDPVTEIALVYSKHEQLPKGYKLIETTVGGQSANLNAGSLFSNPMYLCYLQSSDKPPIIEISVFHANQNHSPPPGHVTLAFSLGGRSADLSRSGRSQSFLTLKRGLMFGHNNAITGLCVVGKGEEPPPRYKILHSLDLGKGLVGPSLYLCYRTSQVHPDSVAYTPELLARYPTADHPEFPLPGSVPLFCLPFGVSIEHWDRHTPFPLPSFSTFALTNAQGQCMYGAVVVFYEPLVEHKCMSEMKQALGVVEQEQLHMNKCICLLSHWPFFQPFKSFLSALYRLSISKNIPLPLERYIGNLMLEVPFPSMMRPRVLMPIGNETILFSLPVQTPLPLSVSTHWTLLSSLDPDNCTTLLALMLLEQKMVLHSSRPALLTCVGEALRSILFPFSWQCTYIPLCPMAFASYLQAPVPFIIGMDSRYFDIFEKPVDVSVIDLDANIITLSKDAKQLLKYKPLPSRPARTLRQSLSLLASRVSGLDTGMDLAVEVAPMEYRDTYKTDLETIDVEIREVFLRFFATTMGHYRKCLRPLLSAPSERSRDAEMLFDQNQFLKHCSSNEWPFFKYFFDTQIFNGFVEQRSFDHSESTAMAFFDECSEKIKAHPQAKLLDAVAIVNKRSDLPTVVSIPPDTVGLPPGQTYSYPVYPTELDHTLFCGRVEGEGSISRTPSLRTILPGSPIVGRRTQAEKTKDKQCLHKALLSNSLWSKTLLSHVCSLWYVLLSSHLSTHWNKMEVLSQALELLEEMRRHQALPNDEVCYRILMEQCVKLHRPALAVRVYHEMIKAGIQPNAVTYSFYNSAVLEGEWPSSRRKWKILITVVCVCLYLTNLKNKSEKQRLISTDQFDEVDFSLITRKGSVSSRKSISALDVVGVAEGAGSLAEEEGLTLKRRALSHSGSAYRLTRIVTDDRDHMISGGGVTDSSDTGLWSNVRLSAGGPSSSPTHIRRLSRVVSAVNLGDSPSLKIEMTSCTQCSSCKRLLYDELIMAGWSIDEGDYKTTCPYCSHRMVASLTISTQQQTHTQPTTGLSNQSSDKPMLTTPTFITEENEDQVDFDLRTKSWDRRHARANSQDNLLAKRSGSKVKQISNHRTDIEDKLTGAVEYSLDSNTSPSTDPLHRRAITDSNLQPSQPLNSRIDVVISSANSVPNSPAHTASGMKNGNGTLSTNTQSTAKNESTEYKGQDDPDVGGLSSYIAQMRSRGHKRSTSAPVRPLKDKMGGVSSLATTLKRCDKGAESLSSNTKVHVECSPPLVVPYLSPIVLRKEVETLLSLDGSVALEREELVKDRPIIYWNLVWYFSRLRLPTHLPLLTLRNFAKTNTEFKKRYIEMKVNLYWDSSFSDVRPSLYNLWLSRVSGTSVFTMSTPELKRRDSESQLQSLVARTQCGDLLPVITSLLRDKTSSSHDSHLTPRSVYRETLFLKSVLTSDLDIDLFDKEYNQLVNRLPKDLSPLVHTQDLPPTNKALNCRRDFGPLQISP